MKLPYEKRVESPDSIALKFGKYASQTPEQIADLDPGYIVWLYDEFDSRLVSRALYLACDQKYDKQIEDIDYRAGGMDRG